MMPMIAPMRPQDVRLIEKVQKTIKTLGHIKTGLQKELPDDESDWEGQHFSLEDAIRSLDDLVEALKEVLP